MADNNKVKHLEFIQNIITRMNTNSFQIKGMAITIVAAFMAIYAANKDSNYIILAIITLLLFWFLDTYYLTLERRFRALYNKVIQEDSKIKLFDMDIKAKEYKKGNLSFVSVFLIVVYGRFTY